LIFPISSHNHTKQKKETGKQRQTNQKTKQKQKDVRFQMDPFLSPHFHYHTTKNQAQMEGLHLKQSQNQK
jgi:hypothetical protein